MKRRGVTLVGRWWRAYEQEPRRRLLRQSENSIDVLPVLHSADEREREKQYGFLRRKNTGPSERQQQQRQQHNILLEQRAN